jgi:ribonucleoside-diphosphate reductase alpha chain
MSIDLAHWLGMMAADGHTTESTGNVGISEKDSSNQVGALFDALCLTLFGRFPRVTVDKRTGVRTRYLSSRALARYTADLIGKGARNKRVPDQVLVGSTLEKLAFLNGVTLDGHLSRNQLVVYSGVSARLADGIEALCRSLGRPSCWRWTEAKSDGYLVHQVRVSDELQKLIHPVEFRKYALSPRGGRFVRVPAEVHSMSLPYKHSEFSNLRSLQERKPDYCLARTLEKLDVPLVDPNEYLVKIESIQRGEAATFDIEVEDAHSYIVNGLVSHNTINAPNDDTIENVSRSILRAYKKGCKGFTYYRDGSRTEQVVTFSREGDIKGANRDVTAGAPAESAASASTEAVVSGGTPAPATDSLEELNIEELLAKANALLETR